MSEPKDHFNFIHRKLPSDKDRAEKDFISASGMQGELVENLKLLKALIQSEKVKTNLLNSDLTAQKNQSPLEKVQETIIEELSTLDIEKLALFDMSKKYIEECFELLISAWRRKIQHNYPQTLTFAHIRFSKVSFKAFIIALTLNVTLKALRLESCQLGPFEIKLLAVLIKVHPALEFLHLDHNPVEDEGLYSIIAALKVNTQIEHLSLIDTQITDEGALQLGPLILKRPFKSLHLEKNKLTKKSLTELQKACEGSYNILTYDEPID
ncbi:MAG: hypothetical protein S4CHLAM6_07970 [Chlamydiae bacterium]|nr:hypothetical protein [Chlamydiota bacterium]